MAQQNEGKAKAYHKGAFKECSVCERNFAWFLLMMEVQKLCNYMITLIAVLGLSKQGF